MRLVFKQELTDFHCVTQAALRMTNIRHEIETHLTRPCAPARYRLLMTIWKERLPRRKLEQFALPRE